MTAPPEVRDIAVHQKHRKERDEPKSIDLCAMTQRLHGSCDGRRTLRQRRDSNDRLAKKTAGE